MTPEFPPEEFKACYLGCGRLRNFRRTTRPRVTSPTPVKSRLGVSGTVVSVPVLKVKSSIVKPLLGVPGGFPTPIILNPPISAVAR